MNVPSGAQTGLTTGKLEVGKLESWVGVERGGSGMKSRIRRKFHRSKCLRRISRLVHHLSRCCGCIRPRVYQCTTSAPAHTLEEDNVQVSSIGSLFCTQTICVFFSSNVLTVFSVCLPDLSPFDSTVGSTAIQLRAPLCVLDTSEKRYSE